MPRKAVASSKQSKKRPVAPETSAAVLRALDNLDAAVSKLSDVVGKIIARPCEIPQVNSAEHSATLVPSEIGPPLPSLGAAPTPAVVDLSERQPTTQMPPADGAFPTEPEPQHGFAERLLSARHRTQQ